MSPISLKSAVLPISVMALIFLSSEIAFASVESTMAAMQTKLVTVILPLAGILGLIFAALSFFTGNPNAKNHVFLAIAGAVVGFGSSSIIAFIRGLVQ